MLKIQNFGVYYKIKETNYVQNLEKESERKKLME
jgi:hypothetical protein